MSVDNSIKPVFIFSLPRSGSTLLQRVLATYDEVSTTAEPWVLLPVLYALKKEGVYSEYSHCSAYIGLQDFCEELPNGDQDYLSAIGVAMLELYSKAASPEAMYFLDKTPRYALISDEILRMFPDGKAVFLWRNPLAVIASMIDSFNNGKWNIFHSKVDLFDGMENLIRTYEKNESNVLAIRYEDLVGQPKDTMLKITNYLNLQYGEEAIAAFSEIKLKGVMGDPIGVKGYKKISADSLDKWKVTLASPLRKIWCRRYLRWLREDRLQVMGYNLDALLSELDDIPTRWTSVVPDFLRTLYGITYCVFELKIVKDKARKLLSGKRLKRHN